MYRFDTRYSGLKENEVYLLFGTESWERMSPGQRLDALQEVENRFAGRDGREPYRVAVIPPEQRSPGTQGYMVFDPEVRPTIYLNENFFSGDADYLDSSYNAVTALETVLHEGRHCYQYEAVLRGNDAVDPLTLQAWAANVMNYIQSDDTYAGFGVYEFQPLERDANHFAASELKEIYRHMVNLSGERDGGFEAALTQLFESRMTSVLNVAYNVSETLIDAYCDEVEKALQQILDDELHPYHDLAVMFGLDPDCAREYVFRDVDVIKSDGESIGEYLDGLDTVFSELDDFSDLADDLARFDAWHDHAFTVLDGRWTGREKLDRRVDTLDRSVHRFRC